MTDENLLRNNRKKIAISWNHKDPDHIYVCRQYEIQFPDTFSRGRDTKYDFYACLNNPENPEKPYISIKPGRQTMLQTFGMEIHSKELLLAVLRLNALKGMGGLLWIADRSESFSVTAGNNELLCYYDRKDRTSTFYVYMVFRNATRPIIITLDGLDLQLQENEKELVEELISHLTVKQPPFIELPSLTSREYSRGILILQTAEKWKQLRKQYMEELEHIFFIHLQITQQRVRQVQKRNFLQKEMTEEWYRQDLKDYAEAVDRLVLQTAEYLKLIYDTNRENPVFYELASDMENFLQENQTVSVSIDHEEQMESVKHARGVLAKWQYCVLKQQVQQAIEKRDVLADMDRNLQADYESLRRQKESLIYQLENLEKELADKKEGNRLAAEEELEKVSERLREKELELGQCYAQQKTLKAQIQNTSFLHRHQKEQLTRQLSAIVIRLGKIRAEIDMLEDRKADALLQADENLDEQSDAVKSYRLRLRLKEEEIHKARKIIERNRKLLEERQGELRTLQEAFRKVAAAAKEN